MARDDTTTMLVQAGEQAIRLMLSKLEDHDVTVVYDIVGGAGPIGDLAAEAMKDRDIDL